MTEQVASRGADGSRRSLRLRVDAIEILCEEVRRVVLIADDGSSLPSFAAGSHVSIEWQPGRHNSYSLTGPSIEPDHYAISVRLDEFGRGGSRWVHSLAENDVVEVGLPRSAFAPILSARHHVLIAGGIGVTPILSHVRDALQWKRSFEVLYVHRPGRGAHAAELQDLCGTRLTTFTSAGELRRAVSTVVTSSPLGTHLYSCGPQSMIDAVAEAARGAGWPRDRIHSEAFGASTVVGGRPFAAKLGRSGLLVPVRSESSLLEALLDKGVAVPNLCRQGVCGECRLTVRGGQVEHRDLFLTDTEKAAGDSMMPCVSRATGDLLELEL
ncbi:oxidoreductase [Rhodococcus sp. 05-339-2]|uniref:PDR/VanB family oxidoreductase n=1 Tax=Rhodococcoides fascians TaxID=1828 RepID=UPI00050BF2E0|nr:MULTISPECIES: PDR/VanB family oxidoreductase [Rhodococcus]OZD81347.1 oxidoreductase [Rhodococcus sp. 05-339-2]